MFSKPANPNLIMPPRRKNKPLPVEKAVAEVDRESPHSGGKKRIFRCQFCAKHFQRNEHLQRHERLHTKEKPFRCIACSDAFTRSDLLTRHFRVSHPNVLVGQDDSALDIPSLSPSGTFMMSGEEPSVDTSQALPPPMHNFGDFALFVDSMSMPCSNDPSSLFWDQPLLPMSPFPLFATLDQPPANVPTNNSTSSPHLFDEFSSTFPSFEQTPSAKSKQEPWKITQEDWGILLAEIQSFMPLIPPGFSLPSRHTITRYIATYFSGFHRHLPFLHIPTFSSTKVPVELILAMATIGAQSSFDNDTAVMLFRTSQAIVLERLRRRKAELCAIAFPAGDGSLIESHTPSRPSSDRNYPGQFQPLPSVQTLLLLMAVATWGNSKAIYNEAVSLQNTLVNLVREESFLDTPTQTPQNIPWRQWVDIEGFKRTIAIVFCFFIFHTIVYDTPPAILNSELNIYLPSHEKDWAARTEQDWQEIRRKAKPESQFQPCLSLLFSKQPDEPTENSPNSHSSLGGYTLILALIQHIYFLRQMSKCKPRSDRNLPPTDIADVEQALRNWQSGWYLDPESSLSPGSPQGPISFNSTALLRMAYIRLNVDVGPWRALNTHDAHAIATSIHHSPPLSSSHKITRAVLYSAHALSIPVKIGVNIVARNQAFTWSLQHSLCALECAFVLTKWLVAVQNRAVDEDETRLLVYITDMLVEADPGFRPGQGTVRGSPDLGIRVIKVWAKLLSGEAVWDVVRLIGKVLEAYGEILEGETTV
ncbi:hypothetical protein FE257_011310 [Aspergillus nanangensis]|uniref:C2H2-type domain-containing protein n=1 Tax=Aspergillus nanangensis TaxID=2582783 RepID=A0AAD4CHF4_ASPNN|nr:hypothetical protein FE257_011310 [Aspergillus nanangensis]